MTFAGGYRTQVGLGPGRRRQRTLAGCTHCTGTTALRLSKYWKLDTKATLFAHHIFWGAKCGEERGACASGPRGLGLGGRPQLEGHSKFFFEELL
jgi:hypothetical protein